MLHGDGYMFFGGGFMWIFWILLFVAVIWAMKAISGGSKEKSGKLQNNDTPLDILKKRYAQGEIDKEEYEEKKGLLRK